MKAWIYEGLICPILPAEEDPETMGEVYDISIEDTDSWEDARQLAKHAEHNYRALNERIIRKLRQGH